MPSNAVSHALAYHQEIAACLCPSESISVSEAGRGGEGSLPRRSVSFLQENQGPPELPYRPDFGLVDIIQSPRKNFENEGYRQPYVIVQQTQDSGNKERGRSERHIRMHHKKRPGPAGCVDTYF